MADSFESELTIVHQHQIQSAEMADNFDYYKRKLKLLGFHLDWQCLIWADISPALRPPLDKKLFPVGRPSGFKRADWNFFLKKVVSPLNLISRS